MEERVIIETEELVTLGYADFMRGMTNAPFDREKCDECGGTGFIPIFCCDGEHCGCKALPVDFKDCDCSCPIASDELIYSWIPEEYKTEIKSSTVRHELLNPTVRKFIVNEDDMVRMGTDEEVASTDTFQKVIGKMPSRS